jgi:hypothetical protein
MKPEPVFVNLLRSPGIDSQPGRPVQQPCTYSVPSLHRLFKNSCTVLCNKETPVSLINPCLRASQVHDTRR